MISPDEASRRLRQMALTLMVSSEDDLEDLWLIALQQFKRSELRRWRERILLRDDNQCRMCGKTEFIEAHHIFPKAIWPEMALLMDNGIALCFPCHRCVVHGCTTFDLQNFQVYTDFFGELIKGDKHGRYSATQNGN